MVSAEGINSQVLRCWLLIHVPSIMTPEEITEGINSQAPTEVQNMIMLVVDTSNQIIKLFNNYMHVIYSLGNKK